MQPAETIADCWFADLTSDIALWRWEAAKGVTETELSNPRTVPALNDGLGTLTTREREVLALMAEGRSNAAIAAILVVSERSVEKHVGNIFSKLGLPPSDADHRRVLAVLRYLES